MVPGMDGYVPMRERPALRKLDGWRTPDWWEVLEVAKTQANAKASNPPSLELEEKGKAKHIEDVFCDASTKADPEHERAWAGQQTRTNGLQQQQQQTPTPQPQPPSLNTPHADTDYGSRGQLELGPIEELVSSTERRGLEPPDPPADTCLVVYSRLFRHPSSLPSHIPSPHRASSHPFYRHHNHRAHRRPFFRLFRRSVDLAAASPWELPDTPPGRRASPRFRLGHPAPHWIGHASWHRRRRFALGTPLLSDTPHSFSLGAVMSNSPTRLVAPGPVIIRLH